MMFSINFLRCCWSFRQLPSTYCASAGHSVNFLCIHRTLYKLSVHLRNIPENFMQLPDLPSTSVNFLCICRTIHLLSVHLQIFYQIPSAFCVRGLFKNVLYGYWIFCQHQSPFRAVAGLSVSFLCVHRTFRQLPSTFYSSKGLAVNFLCVCGTFRPFR